MTDLKALLVSKDSCTLGWKKPITDGGSHITAYVLEIMEGEDKWKVLVKSKNMQYSAKDLEEGKGYSYRVKAVNEAGESAPVEFTVVAKDEIGKQ